MAKRFVDTDLWQKEWFQNLSLKHKILLKYIFENCDCAGIWEFNFRMASFIIGENVTIDDIKEINQIKKQFEILDNKLYICDFIKFQYGKLSYACKPHLPVIKLLKKNGIEFEILDENDLTIKQMRKRLTETAKKQIFIRDKFECQYCGSKEDLEIDHIIPLSQGGNNEDSNLITACHRCNSLKGDKKLKDFLENNREIKFLDRVSKILDTLEEKEKEKEKDKDKDKEENKEKEKKSDPYISNVKTLFISEYEKIFNAKPFLSANDCNKLLELSANYADFAELIPQSIQKLKNIEFKDIDFTPSASWLLRADNFERVMNGEFAPKEKEKTWRELLAEKAAKRGIDINAECT